MSWLGIDGLFKGLERVAENVDLASKQIISESGATVVALAQRNFEGVHKPGKPHVGGDKPNVVLGNLRRSIRMNPITKIGRAEYVTRVGPNAVYGRRIELGYSGGAGRGRQPTRAFPYFTPAVEDASKLFAAIRERALAKYLR